MDERTHPVNTGGVRFKFSANLRTAQDAMRRALRTADLPIMHAFLEPIGRADTLLDLNEALRRVSGILESLDALPPKVEFKFKDE